MARVWRVSGRSLEELLRQPYYQLRWLRHQLDEIERIEGLVRESEQLHLASLVAIAVNNPPGLRKADEELERRLVGSSQPTISRDDAIARGQAILQLMSGAQRARTDH